MYSKICVYQGNQTIALVCFKHRTKDCTSAQAAQWFLDLHPEYDGYGIRVESQCTTLTMASVKREYKNYTLTALYRMGVWQASKELVLLLAQTNDCEIIRDVVDSLIDDNKTLLALPQVQGDDSLIDYLEHKRLVYDYFLTQLPYIKVVKR